MNEHDVVVEMINFIENKERELQANKMNVDSQVKNDVVKMILDELERVSTDEDK